MTLLWLQLFACAAAILVSGANLSKLGDRLADLTGLGRTWIGVVLIASVTSLPELITGITAVTVYDAPDIAVGNVLGASMVNVLLIAVLDVAGGGQALTARVHQGHVLTASIAVLFLGVIAAGFVVHPALFSLFHVGVYSILIALLYFASMRVIFSYEMKRLLESAAPAGVSEKKEKPPLPETLAAFALNAVVIAAASVLLPGIAEKLAVETGWGQSFIGSVFVALSTTLPEIVVAFSALRLGALDLAVGNAFGSVLFNTLILAVEDAVYVKGPILSHVSAAHAVSAVFCIAMIACAVIGLTVRAGKRFLLFVWDSFAIVVIYLFGIRLLFHQ